MNKSIICGLAALVLAGSASADWQDEERVRRMQDVAREAREQAEIETSRRRSRIDVFGFVQFRWMYDNHSVDGVRHGFDVRKGVLGVKGRLAKDWSFVLSGEWTPDSSLELRDAYVDGKNLFEGVDLRVGRFRMPFMAEWQVNEPQLLGNDYSLIAYTLGQGRSEGVQLSKEFGEFDVQVSYNNGFETENTTVFGNEAWGMSGRIDWKLDDRVNIGGAMAYNSTDMSNGYSWTIDGRFTFTDELFGFASYTGQNDSGKGDAWGVLTQLGYTLEKDMVLFGQYQAGEFTGTSEFLSIASVGLNYFFAPNVRWTNELGYSFNAIGSQWDVDQTGWSNSGRGGQVLFTTQMTVSF